MRTASNYKQVRVTLTESRDVERAGRVVIGVRVWVKPHNVEWHSKHVVLATELRDQDPLADMQAVYQALLEFVAGPPLPGHIG